MVYICKLHTVNDTWELQAGAVAVSGLFNMWTSGAAFPGGIKAAVLPVMISVGMDVTLAV